MIKSLKYFQNDKLQEELNMNLRIENESIDKIKNLDYDFTDIASFYEYITEKYKWLKLTLSKYSITIEYTPICLRYSYFKEYIVNDNNKGKLIFYASQSGKINYEIFIPFSEIDTASQNTVLVSELTKDDDNNFKNEEVLLEFLAKMNAWEVSLINSVKFVQSMIS